MKNVVKPRATCKILSLKLVIFIVKTNVSKLSKYSNSNIRRNDVTCSELTIETLEH